jgi:hypothetical protein
LVQELKTSTQSGRKSTTTREVDLMGLAHQGMQELGMRQEGYNNSGYRPREQIFQPRRRSVQFDVPSHGALLGDYVPRRRDARPYENLKQATLNAYPERRARASRRDSIVSMDREYDQQLPSERDFGNPQRQRVHSALGVDHTAPAFLRNTYRRHVTVLSRVDYVDWKQYLNQREAVTASIDCLMQDNPKDALEVMVRRLRALMQADRQRSWKVAEHLESLLARDVDGLVEAEPLRAAVRSANLYDRASIYEEKSGDIESVDQAEDGSGRRGRRR